MANVARTKFKAVTRPRVAKQKLGPMQPGMIATVTLKPDGKFVLIPCSKEFKRIALKGQEVSAPDNDPVQEAFRKAYPDYIASPVNRIESSWAKIDESLRRMEKKLQGIAG